MRIQVGEKKEIIEADCVLINFVNVGTISLYDSFLLNKGDEIIIKVFINKKRIEKRLKNLKNLRDKVASNLNEIEIKIEEVKNGRKRIN